MKFDKWFYGKKGGSDEDYEDTSCYNGIREAFYDTKHITQEGFITYIRMVVEMSYREGYRQAQKELTKDKNQSEVYRI